MKFVASLSITPTDMRWMPREWDAGGDPRKPFAHVLVSPLYANPDTVRLIRHELKDRRGSEVYFDSGGFWVQQGKIRYTDLYDKLLDCYRQERWADWYVLPDHVPTSADAPKVVEHKVHETRMGSCSFFRALPADLQQKALAVVQGHSAAQAWSCVRDYLNIGVPYVGFGSFGTTGSSQQVNVATASSITLMRYVLSHSVRAGVPLHTFGITVPPLVYAFARLGVSSVDGSGWMIAAGYGNVFFPGIRGRLVTHRSLNRPHWSAYDVARLKLLTGHECPFCERYEDLRDSRRHRILHNLCAYMDTLELAKNSPPAELRALWADEQPHYLPILEAVEKHETVDLPHPSQRNSSSGGGAIAAIQ